MLFITEVYETSFHKQKGPNLNWRRSGRGGGGGDFSKSWPLMATAVLVGEETEKWAKHYSSSHQILLVGDGDFSFSLSLAFSFGSASNIVASSFDTYDDVIKKYKKAKSNLENLDKLGALCLHGVDATKMKLHSDLKMRKFDRVIFNFPHAGFHGKEDDAYVIRMHRNLLVGFFRNSSCMLRVDGEVHVNHKTTAPFCHWNLEELASKNSLVLIECVDFKREDFPSYDNKRGDGARADEPFPLGESSTFKFCLHSSAKISGRRCRLGSSERRFVQFQGSMQMQQHPTAVDSRQPQTNFAINFTYAHSQPLALSNDFSRIFGAYLRHIVEAFGETQYDMAGSVRGAVRRGFENFMAEPQRRPGDYIILLEELHHISVLRYDWLLKELWTVEANC